MGLDVHPNMTLGVLVTKADFFKKTGKRRRCASCSKPRGPEIFCPDCGGRVGEVDVEEATQVFAAYAQLHGMTPEVLFDKLLDAPRGGIGLHSCGAMQTSENTDQPLAFGFRLAEGKSHRGGNDDEIAAEPLQGAIVRAQALSKHLEALKITDRPIQLFCGAYYSY